MALERTVENCGSGIGPATDVTDLLESRWEVRVGVQHPVEVYSPSFDLPLPARIRDVGTGGMCIATPSPIPLDKLGGVGFELPEGRIRLDVEGVWQTSMSMDEAVLTGLKFLRTDPESRDRLWEWVDSSVREVGDFLMQSLRGSKLNLGDAKRLAQSTRVRVVPRGRYVYKRGQDQAQDDDAIFFVREGAVELSIPRRTGPASVTARLGVGSIFGGLGCIVSIPPCEDAQATEDTTIIELSRPAFNYLRIAQPLLAHSVSQIVMAGHLRRMDRLVSRVTETT